jgi:hypothetical protein
MSEPHDDLLPEIGHVLTPGEVLDAGGRATDAVLAVTDRRLLVATGNRVALDIGYHELRRIQFDIERRRPATLVIVPDSPDHEPQVLAIPHAELRRISNALTIVGERFSHFD